VKSVIGGGLLAGCALFMGASLQQIGLVYTTAGKAGFITGLYVVIVPILGLIWKQKTSAGTWIGAFLAAIGLYLLSVTEKFTIARGDSLVLIGAFFWAGHVQLIGWLTRKMDSLQLAFFQFLTCSFLSLFSAAIVETISIQGLISALIPICYGGLCSVGIAYTLQVVAQRHAHAAHAAIILSLESVFAVIGGWLLLDELLAMRGIIGCILMLAGMLLSQFNINLHSLKTIVRKMTELS
jgi:drug/metabolite transporter (DMT)-like permease